MRPDMQRRNSSVLSRTLNMTGLAVLAATWALGQESAPAPLTAVDREKVLEEIRELKQRLAKLEAIVEGSGAAPPETVTVAPAPAPAAQPQASAAAAPQPVAGASGPGAAAGTGTQGAPAQTKTPFGFGDFTWMNGQSRQKSQVLTNSFGTLSLYLDSYYGYSFNHPSDNTITGSATVARNTEFTLNLVSVDFSTQYKNIIGEVSFQDGNQLSLIQNADQSVNRGRFLSVSDYRYLGQALAGYHFDKWYGINVEAGLFYSYIGMESYLTGENWNYNRSLLSDYTPFYFEGVRVQIYPDEHWKIEPWIMNGYQSYGKWNHNSAVGLSNYYRPQEWLTFAANFYYGTDERNNPNRRRFHHDDSMEVRYWNRPEASGVSKMAFSLNNHYGFESGGINPFPGRNSYFLGSALAHRVWLHKDHYAFTVRGEALTNPGRYLAIPPTADGFLPGPDNYSFKVWGLTGTFDYLPTDFMDFRAEFLSRHSNVPYFAGPGGTTSPDGYLGTPGLFTPDLAKHENRLTFAIDWRM